ncbi:TAT (twin-arginine translocation) pathway signal sequence domain protein [Campylobacter insulaenigrae]|nr:TAT (twin-arginine translocation) pathway signal sequence domain protein [Campylobacter insulaenigrae]
MEKFDERFDLAKNPNEANRFGWIVEIDPFDAKSTPVKRTSLGRFKHENAEIIIEKDGSVIIYMGDDEADEFIYKFVSKHKFKKGMDTSKILDEGILYVGQFNGKLGDMRGSGKWIASHKESGSKEVFATLTNNKSRKEPNAANPRVKNIYGQIIKWSPKNSHKDEDFSWEIFALSGNPDNQSTLNKGSNNITSKNKFNSTDGLAFDKDGRLWIQTDGNYSNKGDFEGMGNNQILAADVKTGEIKRFLTGPIACELTGIAFDEDYTTMFVGIQHPGEKLAPSHFPHGASTTPRSSVIQIRKLDGGVIGS